MAIYRPTRDSKVWWYEFIFEGQRVRESTKTRSKTVAKDAEKARRRWRRATTALSAATALSYLRLPLTNGCS
jgi:hypothetical protein